MVGMSSQNVELMSARIGNRAGTLWHYKTDARSLTRCRTFNIHSVLRFTDVIMCIPSAVTGCKMVNALVVCIKAFLGSSRI